jgi:ribosome maturation factor RimP
MMDAATIKKNVEEHIEGTGYYIVDFSVSSANHILIELDNDESIAVSDCMKISRYVEHELLDRDVDEFGLEVTSPGLDKPFKMLRQYRKNIGREVEVKYAEDGRKFKGLLKEVTEAGIVLETKKKERLEGRKKKVWVTESHDIAFDKIKETKVVITF